MKLVITDGYIENPGDLDWGQLDKYGEVVIHQNDCRDEDEMIARIGDADIAVINKVKMTRRIIDGCPNLKMIAVTAAGYDVVDYKYAAEKGIPVCNTPGYGTTAVAQYAIGLLLEICGRQAHHSQAVHEGKWEACGEWCFWDYPIIELAGKTIGIIGFGKIGQAVGAIAKALGMKVIAFNRSQSDAGRAIGEYVSLDELLERSDVISLHAPLFPETKGIINKNTIAKMKDGVIIINNSRGPLVVEEDLAEALCSGKVYAAGLDVTVDEPIKSDNPLLSAPNCFITPHISWAARESRQRILDITEANIRAFIEGKPQNAVNMK